MKLLIKSGTVVPMIKKNFFISDILIENGKINKIEPNISDINAIIVNADNCFVLPGFIQCHVHVVQTLLRHNADDLELLDWLKKKTYPYESSINADGVEAAAMLGISELLLGGTTSFLDFGTTHDQSRVFEVAQKMGVRMISGKTHMDLQKNVPKSLLEDTHKSLQEAEDLGKKWHNRGRLQYAVEPRFALSCTSTLMKEASKLARKNKWLLHTHASENKTEIQLVKKQTGYTNIEYLKRMGFTGADVILAHGVHLSSSEIHLLKKSKTRVCHCPGANLKLASGIADIPKLLKNKILVGLGSDGAPCNNRLSIFHEMALAAGIHKIKYGSTAMPAWQVLKMATIDGAKTLHLDNKVGTLEVGKLADIVILKRSSMSMYPSGDPASQIVYGATACDVRDVFIEGEWLVKDGHLKNYNHAEIQKQAEAGWKETKSRM